MSKIYEGKDCDNDYFNYYNSNSHQFNFDTVKLISTEFQPPSYGIVRVWFPSVS